MNTAVPVCAETPDLDRGRPSPAIAPPGRTAATPYVLAGRAAGAGDTIVRIGDRAIGGGNFEVIAGPCAVESRRQLRQTVSALVRFGIGLIRAGAFKPRTSPYDFQGLGEAGLALLREIREEYGVGVVTELVSPRHVEAVAAAADVIQIGARNGLNYDLLQVAAQMGKPVLLKRGMGATVRAWLLAAEHLLVNGCRDVLLCERGISTFESGTRSTLDLGGLALAKRETHLPVLADPSHAAGRRDLVAPLALAATAAGADGLLVEVHCDPSAALCDGPQQLECGSFGRLLEQVRSLRDGLGRA